MNKHLHDETVYRVATDTLESLALMFLVPEEEAANPLPPCSRRVAVKFTGPFEGMLILAASESVLPALAANMLGLENDSLPTTDQQEDALKELVNVVCGNLLPAIAGKEPIFHIDAPQVLVVEQAHSTGNLLQAGQARLLADSGVLELSFFVDQFSPAST